MKKQMNIIIILLILCAVQLNAQFTYYSDENSDIPQSFILDIEQIDEIMWFSTHNSGIISLSEQGIWRVFDTSNSEINANDVLQIEKTSDNKLWYSSIKGLGSYDGVNWVTYPEFSNINGLATFENQVYILNFHDLYRYDGDKWDKLYSFDIISPPFFNLVVDKTGVLWIGFRTLDNILFKVVGDELINVELKDSAHEIDSSEITSMAVDSLNNLWVTYLYLYEQRVGKYNIESDNWKIFTKEDLNYSDSERTVFTDITVAPDNSIFISSAISRYRTPRNLVEYDGKEWKTHQLDSLYTDPTCLCPLRCVASDTKGNIWTGTYGIIKYSGLQSSVSNIDKSKYTIYPNPTTGTLRIELENETLANSYKITDTKGKQVLAGKLSPSSSVSIDVEQLPAGVYIIEITTNSGEIVIDKFVKE